MARSRLLLHDLLKDAVGADNKVYFQPPTDIMMQYPCIVYERSRSDTRHANNDGYIIAKRYTVTVIDRDPDSTIGDSVAKLPMCTHSSFFVNDNLNHDVYDIYF